MISANEMKVSERSSTVTNISYFWLCALFLSNCGSKKSDQVDEGFLIGFPLDYRPPPSDFDHPSSIDPNFRIIEPTWVEPYWVSALRMDSDEIVINTLLLEYDRSMTFSFPSESQTISVSILGWAPANLT